MRKGVGIKPQDILLVLKLIARSGSSWRQMDLAHELGLSQGEIALGLERLRYSGLVDEAKKKPQRLALLEFLIHGLKYVFPPELGSIVRGIPTGHSYGLLNKQLVENSLPYVWPSEEGSVRGQGIRPLYKTAPFAAQQDPALYELLAITDAIRVGRSRDREMAVEQLRKIVLKGGKPHDSSATLS